MYVLIGPVVPISLRYLNAHLDVWAINFWRMLAGALTLTVIAGLWFRAPLRRELASGQTWGIIAIMGANSALSGYLSVWAFAFIPAATGVLLRTIGLPLNIAAALIFFHDERAVASKRRLAVGTAVAFAGALGIALVNTNGNGAADHTLDSGYLFGCVLMFLTTLLDLLTPLLTKRLLNRAHPIASAPMNVWMPFLIFAPPAILFGSLMHITRTSATVNGVLFGSGAAGILIGVVMTFYLIRAAGLIRFNFTVILMPISTAMFGYLLIDDLLPAGQIFFGLITLVGCMLVLRTPPRTNDQNPPPA